MKTVMSVLKKCKLYSKELAKVDYHMDLLNCEISYLISKIPELNGKTDSEIADFLIEIYKKCDETNPEYDYYVDVAMTRIGLKTDDFRRTSDYKIII